MLRNEFFSGAKQAPAWCAQVLSKFGQNRYGENLLRMVFLPSRSKIVGGFWEEDGEVAYKQVPKYGREAKWALERFVPPHFLGSPQSWDALGSTLEGYYAIGPFPAHGVFECCAVFSTGKGPNGYVPLEPGVIELQARLIWMGRQLTRYEIRAAALGEEEEKIKKQDMYFERLLEQKSFSREDATFGMAVNYCKEQAIEDYKVRLVKNKAWQKKIRKFQGRGFGQYGAN